MSGEENAKLEKAVEELKRTQHRNSFINAQIDQFKVEYKLKIDQIKADILNATRNTGCKTGESDNKMFIDDKDKRLNELERTVNALLQKMAQV